MAAPDAGTFDHFYYGELPVLAAGQDFGTGDFFQFGELPFVFHPALAVPQFLRPDSDVAVGGWTPTPTSPTTLFDKIDEVTASDTDYISET